MIKTIAKPQDKKVTGCGECEDAGGKTNQNILFVFKCRNGVTADNKIPDDAPAHTHAAGQNRHAENIQMAPDAFDCSCHRKDQRSRQVKQMYDRFFHRTSCFE